MSDSLFARASTDPAARAASVGRRPIEPVTPLSTTSAPQPAATVAASSPTTTSGADAVRPAREAWSRTASRTASASAGRHGHERDGELHRLAGDEVDVAAGRQRGDGEPVGVACDHLEGLGADRAGGAEDGDGAGGHRPIVQVGVLTS